MSLQDYPPAPPVTTHWCPPTTTLSSVSTSPPSITLTSISTMSTAKLRNWPRFSQALIFPNHLWIAYACKPSKATMAAMFPATSIPFFLSGCCMAQRRSLSGRSPFCQRKLRIKSQIHWFTEKVFPRKQHSWNKQTTNQASWQRREHACQPSEGARDSATKDALRRAKLSVGLRSTRGEKEEEIGNKNERDDLWSVLYLQGRDGWGVTECGFKRPTLPTWRSCWGGGRPMVFRWSLKCSALM